MDIIPQIVSFHNYYPHISGDLCISGKQFSLSYHRIGVVVVVCETLADLLMVLHDTKFLVKGNGICVKIALA